MRKMLDPWSNFNLFLQPFCSESGSENVLFRYGNCRANLQFYTAMFHIWFIWMVCSSSETSVTDPGCLSRIPDPNLSIPDPGYRSKRFWILDPLSVSKNLIIFFTQKMFLSSKKYDPGCPSRIPDHDFLPIPDPGSRCQKGAGTRIRICNTEWNYLWRYVTAPVYEEQNEDSIGISIHL